MNRTPHGTTGRLRTLCFPNAAAWGVGVAALISLVAACDRIGAEASLSVVIPHSSWPTSMPDGIPVPESGTLIFEADIPLRNDLDLGRTPYGERRVTVGGDGSVSGPRMSGRVMPGALDFELTLPNGVVELEQIFVLETSDDHYIYVRGQGTGIDSTDVRTVLEFEAPNDSSWDWLHSGQFVARRSVDAEVATLKIAVYDVSAVKEANANEGIVRIDKTGDLPGQPWDYRVAGDGETRGGELIVETVTLAPSQSVGPTRDGIRRNVIPITGGTLSGRISGTVLFGGADYQNLSPPATIDARYLWETDDGEIIIVRNGGTFGGLVPTFETRIDGPYAWLNTGLYLSRDPTGAPGGVGITMFESTR